MKEIILADEPEAAGLVMQYLFSTSSDFRKHPGSLEKLLGTSTVHEDNFLQTTKVHLSTWEGKEGKERGREQQQQ